MAADHFAIDFTQTYVWVSISPESVHTAIYTTSNFLTNYTTSRLCQTGTFPSQLTFRLLCVCIWTFGVGSWIKYYPSQMSFNEAQRWTRLHCITSWPSAGFNWIHFQSIEAVILSFSCPSSSRWALSHCRAYIAASLSNKTSRCLASLSQSEAQNQYLSLDSSSPLGFLGVPWERDKVALSSTRLRYHRLHTERAGKINSWWGLLLSYQISVWRREATSESWGGFCSSQPQFPPDLQSSDSTRSGTV